MCRFLFQLGRPSTAMSAALYDYMTSFDSPPPQSATRTFIYIRVDVFELSAIYVVSGIVLHNQHRLVNRKALCLSDPIDCPRPPHPPHISPPHPLTIPPHALTIVANDNQDHLLSDVCFSGAC